MNQFEVLPINGGERHLTEVDTSRYDFWIGFRRARTRLLALEQQAEDERLLKLAELYDPYPN